MSRILDILQYPHVYRFIIAWLAAAVLLPIATAFAHRVGALDYPRGYKGHPRPVPFVGGVVIFASIAFALFTTLAILPESVREQTGLIGSILEPPQLQVFTILGGGLLILVVGLMDDFYPISAVVKLLFLFALAFLLSIVLHVNGVRADTVPPDVSGATVWNLAIAVLWIAGVTSAMNSLDHMDGACGGVAAVASLFTFLFYWQTWQFWGSFMAITMFGACLGFLQYNLPPARIFLGDNGSMLLGFLLASLALLGEWDPDPFKAAAMPVLILGVPLFDLVSSTWMRLRSGTVRTLREAIVYCGRDHMTHRLVAHGFSGREAVMILYAMGCGFGLLARLAPILPWSVYGPILAGVPVSLFLLMRWLERAPLPPPEPETPDPATPV